MRKKASYTVMFPKTTDSIRFGEVDTLIVISGKIAGICDSGSDALKKLLKNTKTYESVLTVNFRRFR